MIRTIEDNFDYQAKQIFQSMKEDYKCDQEDRINNGEEIETFSEWLWKNLSTLGKLFYEKLDLYTDIDEFTQEFNF